MKKTELIKNAIETPVLIEDFRGEYNEGWLMVDIYDGRRYVILPFDYKKPAISYRPSHIKHLYYLPRKFRLF